EHHSLVSLYDFWEARRLFSDIDNRSGFCLVTMTGAARPVGAADFVFSAHRVEDLSDDFRRFQFTAEDFRLLNSNTRTCPIFRTRRDAEITRRIYERVPVLIDRTRPEGSPWGVSFMRMFDMTNDSHLFRSREQLADEGWTLDGNVFRRNGEAYLPLYEAKLFHQFDHRFASYEADDETRELSVAEKADAQRLAFPRYWVPDREVATKLAGSTRCWLLAWRDIARSTDERTIIAAALPEVALGHTAPLLFTADSAAALLGGLVSFAADFVARQKTGGTHLTYFIVEQ